MRAKTITISPDALDRDGICAAQTLGAAGEMLINGALSAGYDRDGICQAQTPAASGDMTINGALASGGAVYLSTPRRLLVYSDGDESGVTFTITGTDINDFKLVEAVTGPNATYAFTSGVFKTISAVSISGAGTGNIEVGAQGVGTFDIPRHAGIYCGADMSGVTFTVTGTNRYGKTVSEDITGPNATTVAGSINFSTITKVVAGGAVGTNTEVGSCGSFETEIIPLNRHASEHVLQVILSSDKNYTIDVQSTADNLESKYASGQEGDIDFVEDATLQNLTADTQQNIDSPMSGARCQVTSFVAGSFELTAYSV